MSNLKWKWTSRLIYVIGLFSIGYVFANTNVPGTTLICYVALMASLIIDMKLKSAPKTYNILYKGQIYNGTFCKGQNSIGRQIGIMELAGLDKDMPIFYVDALSEFELFPDGKD